MVIGVDFDNTLVSYDDLLERLARERGFVSGDSARGKKSIRDQIRQLPNGDIEWQKLQGIMYGPRLNEARIMDGVPEFLNACRQRHVSVSIVSHKTEYAGYDDTRTNLRQAALAWMEQPAVLRRHRPWVAARGRVLCRDARRKAGHDPAAGLPVVY
jgi:phosphoglycolate phosphatase-like HAD superfamily hydrolase